MKAVDVQRLWFTLGRRPWSFLVVMPADPLSSAAPLGEALAAVGTQALNRQVRFVNAESLELRGVAGVIEEACSPPETQAATIVAVGSPLVASSAIPLSLAADGVLLAVELGRTEVDAAKSTVEQIGAARFFGAVTVEAVRGK